MLDVFDELVVKLNIVIVWFVVCLILVLTLLWLNKHPPIQLYFKIYLSSILQSNFVSKLFSIKKFMITSSCNITHYYNINTCTIECLIFKMKKIKNISTSIQLQVYIVSIHINHMLTPSTLVVDM